jgi:predicted helicase
MMGDNLALATTRSVEIGRFEHVLCTRYLIGHHTVSLKEVNYLFPLYLYAEDEEEQKRLELEEGRRANLNPEFVKAVGGKLGLRFVEDGRGDLGETFGPEDVFHYAYAVFHSPTYRSRYAEFLQTDFPRLPLTSDRELFAALAAKGAELVGLHLMESRTLDALITKWPIAGSDTVEKVRYDEKERRVWINEAQYFEGVPPEVWGFHVGGYQVCEKWLKDRKGRKLTWDDVQHYQRVVVALAETIRLMGEIDAIIPSWPLE